MGLELKGRFSVDHIRDGKLLKSYEFDNGIVNEGKLRILGVMFYDATQIASTSWFIGMINNSGYSALADTDTMASHSGWIEFTGYSQGNRVLWGQGTPAAQSITNSTPATFNITSTATLKGIFITSSNVKNGTTGLLWSTGLFSADLPVVNGDELKITYTLNT